MKSHPQLFVLLSALSLSSTLYAEGESTQQNASLWQMMQQGGWAMIPLGFCSLALIYLIVYCLRETRADDFGTDALAQRIAGFCESGKHEDAISCAQLDPTLLGRSLATALSKYKPEHHESSIEAMESSVAESLEIGEHAVSQWIHYLNVVATVSPMVGLLGTVSGMIGAFQTMSAGGMGRPELLAGDIGEALITTATGLCIGIPAMVAYSFFNNRLNNLLVENSQRASAVKDSLQDGAKRLERV